MPWPQVDLFALTCRYTISTNLSSRVSHLNPSWNEENVDIEVMVNVNGHLSAEAGIFRENYRKTSNIRRTLESNKIVDHSDVVGASPVGAAPTTSSFST